MLYILTININNTGIKHDGKILYLYILSILISGANKTSNGIKCLQKKLGTKRFKIGKTLNAIMELLDANFVQTHRSCIINTNRIVSVNKSKRLVTFDNGETIDLVSDKFIGELI